MGDISIGPERPSGPARRLGRRLVVLAALVAGGAVALPAPAGAQQTTRLRGTLIAAEGARLTIRPAEGGEVAVSMKPDFTIGRRVRADQSALHAQDFIGVAAVPHAGEVLRAVEVFVFPPAMRGTGEGHRRWDLLPESTMTNATLENTVESVDGKTMRLVYKDGSKAILLTPETRIFTFAPGTAADLKPGRPVTLQVERKDGEASAARITVDDP